MTNDSEVNIGNPENETSLLIAEFNALRGEMIDNFQTARTIVTIYLTAVGAIFFAVFSGSVTAKVTLLVPAISAIFWWVHLDTRMIVAILGGYLDKISERARVLGSDKIFIWEQEIRLKDRTIFKIHPGLIPWKIGGALDGVAYLIYLPPSIIALWISYGKVGGLTLYEDPTTKLKPFFVFPEYTWWISLIAVLIVFLRAIITDRTWWQAPNIIRQ